MTLTQSTPVRDIHGSGGKGGGGSQFFETDDTLKSTAVVRVVEIISEGEIEGVVGGKKGIYLNNTPVMNPDGSENFGGNVAFEQRYGLPDQPYMSGFPSASHEINLGTEVQKSSPVTYATSAPDIDALRITVGLNEGLAFNDTSDGQLKGTAVELYVQRRVGSGAWTEVKRFTISGKTNGSYEENHRIERPLEPGVWSIRVLRETDDNASATLKNKTWLQRVTEIQDVQETYPDTAYVGIAVDARSVGSSSVPVRSYLVKGIKVKVPSNYSYNPTTGVTTYAGVWDGEFKNDAEWCNDPSWVLYDLISHQRYGLGEWVTENYIDRYSFYNAAVYNSAMVNKLRRHPTTGATEVIGQEPRFTFNYQILARQDAAKWIQDIAGMMNAKVVWIGDKVTLLQDRPSAVVKLITNSNVVDDRFSYKSSTLQERVSAVNVTWNDPENHYQQSIISLDRENAVGDLAVVLQDAFDKYGYNTLEFVALGCTSEHQARRAGAWAVDTAISQSETVSFKMFLNGCDVFPGEVVELFDQDYAGSQQAGKLKAGSTTTSLVLDRPVTLSAGSSISVQLSTGDVVVKNIVQTSGSLSTITLTSALSEAPAEYTDFIITTAVAPRQFRISKASPSDDHTIQFDAILHDPNKYARIESGVRSVTPVFSGVSDLRLSAPTNLTFTEHVFGSDDSLTWSLLLSWDKPAVGIAARYTVHWRVSNGGWETIETGSPTAEIRNVVPGTYEVKVTSVGYNRVGGELYALYTVSTAGGEPSDLNPVTDFALVSGGTSFTGQSIEAKWVNPASNAAITTTTIRDFEVKLYTAADVLLRTEYVKAVPPGTSRSAVYSWDANLVDGGPHRSVKVSVAIRDAHNNLTTPVVQTFTNPAPAALTIVEAVGGVGSTLISFIQPLDHDYVGVLVWRSTTPGFTPSSLNLVAQASNDYFIDQVDPGTTYYYRLAPFDQFSRPEDGSGLNMSAEIEIAVSSAGSDGERGSLTGYGANYGLYYSSSWADSSTGTSTQRANRVINNMLTGETSTAALATTTHLRVGDTVTLTNSASPTDAITKYWNGTAWVSPGVVINGNLLVPGTVDADMVDGEPAATVVANANSGATAFTGTAIFRTTGTPSNSPTSVSVAYSQTSDGNVIATVSWSYTQGTRPADALLVYFREGVGTAVAITDPCVATGPSSGSIKIAVKPSTSYRFGVAAGRIAFDGYHETAIVQTADSTSSASNFTGLISGDPAATVVANASSGNTAAIQTAIFRDNSAPTNAPTSVSAAFSQTADGNVVATITYTYAQGTKPADALVVYYKKAGGTITQTDPCVTTNPTVGTNSISIVVEPSTVYRFGVAAARVAAGGYYEGAITHTSANQTSSASNFTGDLSGTPVGTVVANAGNGATAFTETEHWRTNGAPTNSPAFGAITQEQTADGNVVVTVNYTYTQSATLPADNVLVYVRETGGTVLASDPAIATNPVSGSMKFALKPSTVYRFGLAAVRSSEGGYYTTAIVSSASNLTTLAANFTGNIASTPAATLVTAATEAAADAEAALIAAGLANDAVTAMSDDGKLSPMEKQAIQAEWDARVAEKTALDSQADAFGITTEKALYGNRYMLLSYYLDSASLLSNAAGAVTAGNDLLANLTTTSDLNKTYTPAGGSGYTLGAGFRKLVADFYSARQALFNKIAEVAKSVADTANAAVNAMADDATMSPVEKIANKAEWDVLANEKVSLNAQAVNFGITTENTAYNNFYALLERYLTGTSALTHSGFGSVSAGTNFLLDLSVASAMNKTFNFDVTFNASLETANRVNHGLLNGDEFTLTTITSTTGISINTTYYVVGATADSFQIASTVGGAARGLTTNGSGSLRLSGGAAFRRLVAYFYSARQTLINLFASKAKDLADAANTALANKLNKNAADTLQSVLTVDASMVAGLRVGDLVWNSAGARTSGKGVALTPAGIVGHNGTKVTFTISATTGEATFAGALDAASGTFGALTVATGGHIKSGQTAYNTGVGFWLGLDGATAKLSLGNPAGNYLRWTGTALEVGGDIVGTSNIKASAVTVPVGSTRVAALTITATTSGTAQEVMTPLAFTTDIDPPAKRLVIAAVGVSATVSGTLRLLVERVLSGVTTNILPIGGSGQIPVYVTAGEETVVTIPVVDDAALSASSAYTYRLRAYKDSGTITLSGATLSVIGLKR